MIATADHREAAYVVPKKDATGGSLALIELAPTEFGPLADWLAAITPEQRASVWVAAVIQAVEMAGGDVPIRALSRVLLIVAGRAEGLAKLARVTGGAEAVEREGEPKGKALLRRAILLCMPGGGEITLMEHFNHRERQLLRYEARRSELVEWIDGKGGGKPGDNPARLRFVGWKAENEEGDSDAG